MRDGKTRGDTNYGFVQDERNFAISLRRGVVISEMNLDRFRVMQTL